MKSILMKMDLKVYEQLTQNETISAKDDKDNPIEGCGYTFHEWLDKNTVLACVQSEDAVIDTILVDPVKAIDIADICAVPLEEKPAVDAEGKPVLGKDGKPVIETVERVKPELVAKLVGWPVEVEAKDDLIDITPIEKEEEPIKEIIK